MADARKVAAEVARKNPVRKHVREFNKPWKSVIATIESIDESITIAFELLKGCAYWRLPKVRKSLDQHDLLSVSFDGCRLGLRNHKDLPIKKPWTAATNNTVLRDSFAHLECNCTCEHAPGRGNSLKRTEECTLTK